MFDFSLGEIGLIGVIALIVLGPERLPKVARQVGDWIGKAQRYVNQVKADINREVELAELKKLQEEAQAAARSIEASVQGIQSDLTKAGSELGASLDSAVSTSTSAGSDYAWEGGGESWQRYTFARRYKPGPSVDELAEEIARLKRELAVPGAALTGPRRKYAPRARLNRPRIRR
jgi:sec-independent protein translocase protein TatB